MLDLSMDGRTGTRNIARLEARDDPAMDSASSPRGVLQLHHTIYLFQDTMMLSLLVSSRGDGGAFAGSPCQRTIGYAWKRTLGWIAAYA